MELDKLNAAQQAAINTRIEHLEVELYRGRQISFPSHLEPPELGSAFAAAKASEDFYKARDAMVKEIVELTGKSQEDADALLSMAESRARSW